jgi:hypothetical protein
MLPNHELEPSVKQRGPRLAAVSQSVAAGSTSR